MSKQVTVLDYGLGNIFSVSRALEHLGYEVRLTDRPSEVLDAFRLILPGVGAFANGMLGLQQRNLIEPLREYAASGRPLLGICLGMQMLVTASHEFGEHQGLGIIPGQVVPIAGKGASGAPLKVPHIGWSSLERPAACTSWDGTILADLPEHSDTYFVHSYSVVPDRDEYRLADTLYGDFRISAAIRKGNVYGCQFHPEKSGAFGLRIIENFLACA